MTVKSAKKPVSKKTGFVITTAHRGVFFGYGVNKPGAKELTLTDVRMCISWQSTNKGVLGLAVAGPNSSARVTQAVPEMTIKEITAVMKCTPDAVAAWEKGPWK